MRKNNRIDTLQGNAYIDSKRRQALKGLKDLSLIGAGGILGIKALQDTSYKDDLAFTANPTLSTQHSNVKFSSSVFSSNVPKALLDLSPKHFSIPHEYTMILESHLTRKQADKLGFIIPLLSNKYIEHTTYYLNMPMKHNLPFIDYHYDSLGSLLKELESQGFYMRFYDLDSINIPFIKDIFVLLGEKPENNNPLHFRVYNFRVYSSIDPYRTAMNFLDDYMRCFNTNADNTPDSNKYMEFLKALNIIGQNNIRALYVGLFADDMEKKWQRKQRLTTNKDSTGNHKQEQEQSPKLIGRLATTIIMEDGL